MGASGKQLRFHQTQAILVLQGAVPGLGGLAAGDRAVVDGDLFFLLVFEQETLQTALRRRELSESGAEVFFRDLPVPDFRGENP